MNGGVDAAFPDKMISVKSASLVADVNFTGQVMTVHPQRWDETTWPWVRELVAQNVKNVVKRFVLQKETKGKR